MRLYGKRLVKKTCKKGAGVPGFSLAWLGCFHF